MKDKNHMIILVDEKKAFDKIRHQFMIKILRKTGIIRAHLNIIKTIYENPTANTTLSGQRLSVSLKSRNKTRLSAFPGLIQHSTEKCYYFRKWVYKFN